MNNIFLTTDTHFSHSKMVDYCHRPIDYQEKLKKGLDALKSTDTLYHLGDVCFGNHEEDHKRYIQTIKAKKILIRGNHDNKSDHWYLSHGWDFVCERLTNTYYGVRVCFSHRPLPWDGDFDINIHGHLHNLSHRPEERTNVLNYLISLERMGYTPLSLRTLLEPIRQKIQEAQDA